MMFRRVTNKHTYLLQRFPSHTFDIGRMFKQIFKKLFA
jgi:hypothetical protein